MEEECKMIKNSLMRSCHPMVSGLYLLLMLLMTMLTLHPLLLVTSLVAAGLTGRLYYGRSFLLRGLILGISVGLYALLIYPVFNHNGSTPLFYINQMAVTREAILYGATMTTLLVCAFLWCEVGRALLDSERLMYLVGKAFPSLALMLSITFRFLPLLHHRFRSIRQAQMGMGRRREDLSFFMSLKLLGKEISTLLSQTLELSAASSISMEGRGYGTTKRTTYSRFIFRKRDGISCLLFLALGIPPLFSIFKGNFQMNFFPDLTFPEFHPGMLFCWICMCLLAFYPALAELINRIKDKHATNHSIT